MGGSVKIAVRFKDGSVEADTVWTNPLPVEVLSLAFIAQDEAHLRSMLGPDEAFNGEKEVAPSGYGLIVFDALQNQVLSMQEYSSLETRSAHHIKPILDGHDEDEGEIAFHEAIIKQGRVSILSIMKGEDDWQQTSVTSIAGLTLSLNDKVMQRMTMKIKYDLRPWSFTHFPCTQKGAKAMREAMLEAGFALSPEDEAAWASHIKEMPKR